MPLPDRTCAVIQLRTSGWFHSPVAMDKIPSYPVTLLPCIATSLRAWRPHSSLKGTNRTLDRTHSYHDHRTIAPSPIPAM